MDEPVAGPLPAALLAAAQRAPANEQVHAPPAAPRLDVLLVEQHRARHLLLAWRRAARKEVLQRVTALAERRRQLHEEQRKLRVADRFHRRAPCPPSLTHSGQVSFNMREHGQKV